MCLREVSGKTAKFRLKVSVITSRKNPLSVFGKIKIRYQHFQ